MEIGAVRFTLDGTLGERFSSFVAIDRALPEEVARLTGIRDEDLIGAPDLAEVLSRLAAFVGDAWLVGHNVRFDLAFLAASGFVSTARSLDTAELASCLLPTTASYALQQLVTSLELPAARPHRAYDDARAAALLCCALAVRARSLPVETLEGAVSLAQLLGEGARWFFEQILRQRARTAFLEPARAAAAPSRRGPRGRVDAALGELFAAAGPLAGAFGSYEERPQQLAMAEAVEHAMRDGGVLLVEAGTGTGKSLAYLVPAVRAALAGRRVVVSTYTITLQDQLVRKDLPQLLSAFGVDLRVAVLKGRSNYLCPRRWHLLRATAATPDEARVALKTLVWRESTETGDRAELNLAGGEQPLWQRLCAEDETCTARRCALVPGGCYLERARAAAEQADLVVVNHALLLADARGRNRLLSDAPIVVVDEAHHVEEVAATIWSARLEAAELRAALRRVAHGPLVSAIARLEPESESLARVGAEADRAFAAIDETFAALAALMPPPEERGFEDRRRVTEGLRTGNEWLAVEMAAERLRDALAAVVAAGERLLSFAVPTELAEAAVELEAALQRLREADVAIQRCIHAPRGTDVCWLALEGPEGAPVLQAAPAHAGPLVERSVVAPRSAAVFTSATLAVGESFAFTADRLGVGDRAATLRLDSPFDYRRQALLVLPSELADPYDPAFVDQVAGALSGIARGLGGGTLALFTAHTMLRATHERLAARLDGSGVVALAQSTGGSRRALLERFAQGHAVLLGTASFWEGVDLPGDLLRCVVVVKLPFPVPDDPVVAGRAERYDDPFREYHVPVAALRLKQGFGRLIRTRDDRGAVVLLDRRVSVRSYGEVLLSALPPCRLLRPDIEVVGGAVAAWCAATGPVD